MSILTINFLSENRAMIDDQKRRVEKLKTLIGSLTIAAFCRKYENVDPTYISQILNGHRSFGEKAARTMEEKLGLESGWFDRANDDRVGVQGRPWPFFAITYDEYQKLGPDDKTEIETILGLKAKKVRANKSNSSAA